ncbi:hypothetical protein BCV70DRAFT_199927 [Testicularia cyperi]|uniref:ATP-grasp domain-containing protein n=1 Tax=Testicularia cyperi TaxID=1882483 RepID=A0A317XS07_9BASI|nr:hypothetical protein BCV70DRAFT_199927 [Testicularia cyperi]
MSAQLPSRLQSTLSTLFLLSLSLLLAPLTFSISLLFSLTHPSLRHRARNQQNESDKPTRAVLVNGARMQKSLAVCRAFARNGWRVVLTEEHGWGNLAAPRFSNSVSSFHLLPSSSTMTEGKDSRESPYVKALVELALREEVDLFFPCSGAGSTGMDAMAGQVLLEKTGGRVRSMIQTPELVETLHEKDRFIALLQQIDMAAPRSEIVYTVQEAMQKLRTEGYPRCILKCVAELDDVGRADMTLYPLLGHMTGEPDWQATEKRLVKLSIPLCPRTPYILQEFIGDRNDPSGKPVKASEWCTHATVVDGKLTAFVCCPSNDMLMSYYPASHTVVGEMALRWTSIFLHRLQRLCGSEEGVAAKWSRDTLIGSHAPNSAGITGQFSMDFIFQPATSDEEPGRLVAIECNPRVHTAICLLTGDPALGDALAPAHLAKRSNYPPSPSLTDASLATGNADPYKADEVAYLSSLFLPVMERRPSPENDLSAFKSLQPSWASSRLRIYRAKNLIHQAYSAEMSSLPRSWIGHDLPARILPNTSLLSSPLVQRAMAAIHPLWKAAPKASSSQMITVPPSSAPLSGSSVDGPLDTRDAASFDLASSAPLPPFTDPAFAKDDPWPFFALYHLQWPQLLLWQLLVRRKKWTRINVSTARIFEC